MIDEFQAREVHGEQIKGPMKWIVLILGPNHQAKDLRALSQTEYRNVNVIILLIKKTNLSSRDNATYMMNSIP